MSSVGRSGTGTGAQEQVPVGLWGPPQGPRHDPPPVPSPDGADNGADDGTGGIVTRPVKWGLPTALVGIIVWLSLSVLLTTAILVSVMDTSTSTDPAVLEEEAMRLATTGRWMLLLQAGSWIGMAVPVGWAYLRGGQLGFTFRRSDLWIGVGFAVVAQGFMFLFGVTLNHAGIDLPSNTSSLTSQTGVYLAIVVIGAALINPVMEELFFRGVFVGAVQRATGRRFGPRVAGTVAIITTSAIFGVFHFTEPSTGGLMLVLATGLLGAGLATLRVVTGRLGGAIIGHVLFNSFSLALTFLD